MVEEKRVADHTQGDTETTPDETVDASRRAALKNIGALAGAAPAVAVLLTPSASRALGSGGSPCEGRCGPQRGRGPSGAPSDPNKPGGEAGLLGKREN